MPKRAYEAPKIVRSLTTHKYVTAGMVVSACAKWGFEMGPPGWCGLSRWL